MVKLHVQGLRDRLRILLCFLTLQGILPLGAEAGEVCSTLDAQHRTQQVADQLRRPNLFIDSKEVDLVDRQYQALQILESSLGGNLSTDLRAVARNKLSSYPSARKNPQLLQRVTATDHFTNQRDALEFVIQSFRSPADAELRRNAIQELGNHLGSDMRSAELLLPSIRGVETLYPAEPVDANAAVIRITDRGRGRLPVAYVTARRYRQRFGHENVINLLPSSALTNLRAIGDGNVNVTLFLEFRLPDGRRVKGVFKPFFGQNGYGRAVPDLVSFTREIQASDFYYEFFQHPRIIFPETRELIVTTVDRSYGVGSFQLFLEGFRTVNEMYGGHDGRPVPPASPRYIEVWDRQRLDPRWSDVGPWIAVYDYLLGNTDRFQNSRRTWGNPNNIMVRELDGGRSLEIGLIDTGNGRRIRPDGEFGLRDIPDPRTYSPQLIEAVTRADTEINRIRDSYGKVLSTNGVDDLATRIQQVRQKIRSDLGR